MLVIFDCDGVLIDSEEVYAQIFCEQLAKHGFMISAKQCKDLLQGLPLKTCYAVLEAYFDEALPDTIGRAIATATEDAFQKGVPMIDGVEESLKFLQRRQVLRCVASNGALIRIKQSLRFVNLAHYFNDAIFSAEHVERGKPSPDVFLYAAQKMQVAADRCIVIEDSLVGVKAAIAAKMTVLHYMPGEGPVVRKNAHMYVFTQMVQLPVLLAQLF